MTCIITGCALVTTWDNAWLWGDLHELAGCYIFNSVRDKRGEALWHHYAQDGDNIGAKQLRILSGEASVYLELHGVIIVPKMNALLNDAAQAYVDAGRKL